MDAAKQKELIQAVNDVIESAQGGKYGEIICDADDFTTLEKVMDGLINGKTYKEQMQSLPRAGTGSSDFVRPLPVR